MRPPLSFGTLGQLMNRFTALQSLFSTEELATLSHVRGRLLADPEFFENGTSLGPTSVESLQNSEVSEDG